MAQFLKADDAWRVCSLLSPILALAANVLGQVLIVRARRGVEFFRSVVEGFLLGAFILAFTETFLVLAREASAESLAMSLLVNLPTYGALSYCYFNFANLGHTSIRIRMYSEIAAAASGVDMREMAREYDDDTLMRLRLERLIESGDAILKRNRYFVGRNRFVHISAVLFAIKKFLLGKGSEFE